MHRKQVLGDLSLTALFAPWAELFLRYLHCFVLARRLLTSGLMLVFHWILVWFLLGPLTLVIPIVRWISRSSWPTISCTFSFVPASLSLSALPFLEVFHSLLWVIPYSKANFARWVSCSTVWPPMWYLKSERLFLSCPRIACPCSTKESGSWCGHLCSCLA